MLNLINVEYTEKREITGDGHICCLSNVFCWKFENDVSFSRRHTGLLLKGLISKLCLHCCHLFLLCEPSKVNSIKNWLTCAVLYQENNRLSTFFPQLRIYTGSHYVLICAHGLTMLLLFYGCIICSMASVELMPGFLLAFFFSPF